MRRILLLLLLGLLLSFGCTQSKPSPSNVSNVSNYTAPPSPPPNATGKAVIPPGYEVKDYCMQDSDCVRQRKCCDCGIGEYVNFYNLEDPVCAGPSCACPIMRSNGACVNNKCVAVPYNETQTGGEFYFRANQSGNCGTESIPTKNVTPYGTTMVGYVSTPNPCYTAEASTETGDNGTLIVRITTKPLL
jgi:hypothetical protein